MRPGTWRTGGVVVVHILWQAKEVVATYLVFGSNAAKITPPRDCLLPGQAHSPLGRSLSPDIGQVKRQMSTVLLGMPSGTNFPLAVPYPAYLV